MTFGAERSFLNHSILKNDFLARLTRRIDVIANRSMEFDERQREASRFLLETNEVTENMRRAIAVWVSDADGRLSERITAFMVHAHCLSAVRTTVVFDEHEVLCKGRLTRMDRFVEELSDLPNCEPVSRRAGVWSFWRDALETHDFLSDLDTGSPRFWVFFSPADSSARQNIF